MFGVFDNFLLPAMFWMNSHNIYLGLLYLPFLCIAIYFFFLRNTKGQLTWGQRVWMLVMLFFIFQCLVAQFWMIKYPGAPPFIYGDKVLDSGHVTARGRS